MCVIIQESNLPKEPFHIPARIVGLNIIDEVFHLLLGEELSTEPAEFLLLTESCDSNLITEFNLYKAIP